MSPRACIIEPFTHPAATGHGWAEGLEECGWTVEKLRPGAYVDADLAILMDVPGSVEATRVRQGAKVVVVVSDTPMFPIEAFSKYVSLFIHHSLRHDALDARFAQAGAKLHHLPLAGRRFFSEVKPDQIPRYDACFIGSFYHGDRGQDRYIKPLMDAGLKLFLAGCYGKPGIPYREVATIYGQSKVGINFHYPYQKDHENGRVELNGRTFDLALSGCYQITDSQEAAKSGLGTYARQDEWLGTIQAMLPDYNGTRSLVNQASRELALELHTWGARMREFLKLLDSAE